MGITGQKSSSTSNQTTIEEGGILGSGNNNDSSATHNTQGGDGSNVYSGGNIVVNEIGSGILDTAGSLAGKSLDAIQSTTESAFGFVGRIIESAFGQSEKNQDIIASVAQSSIDSVATANGNPTVGVWQRNGIWIVGGVLAVAALWIVYGRKGKA